VSFGIIRLERNGSAVSRHRVVDLALSEKYRGQVIVGFGAGRFGEDRALITACGFGSDPGAGCGSRTEQPL
jgi:hypothetical protein